MSPTHQQIAEAFSRHAFADTYAYLADDVRWQPVGAEEIVGRDAVISACEESGAYLKTVTTTFRSFRTIAADDHVVTDSVSEYADGDELSVVASCDIYRFADGRLLEITSYTVELPA